MPRGEATGRAGMGPKTGRGAGYGTGNQMPDDMGSVGAAELCGGRSAPRSAAHEMPLRNRARMRQDELDAINDPLSVTAKEGQP